MPACQRNRAGLSFVVVPSTEPIGPALAHRAGVTAASLGATPPPTRQLLAELEEGCSELYLTRAGWCVCPRHQVAHLQAACSPGREGWEPGAYPL